MAADREQVRAAVATVADPELDLPLDRLGMLAGVRTRRRRAEVDLLVPMAGWPRRDELLVRVEQAARTVPGVEEVAVGLSVMDEAHRAELRRQLRLVMAGAEPHPATITDGLEGSPQPGPRDHGHDHAQGHAGAAQ